MHDADLRVGAVLADMHLLPSFELNVDATMSMPLDDFDPLNAAQSSHARTAFSTFHGQADSVLAQLQLQMSTDTLHKKVDRAKDGLQFSTGGSQLSLYSTAMVSPAVTPSFAFSRLSVNTNETFTPLTSPVFGPSYADLSSSAHYSQHQLQTSFVSPASQQQDANYALCRYHPSDMPLAVNTAIARSMQEINQTDSMMLTSNGILQYLPLDMQSHMFHSSEDPSMTIGEIPEQNPLPATPAAFMNTNAMAQYQASSSDNRKNPTSPLFLRKSSVNMPELSSFTELPLMVQTRVKSTNLIQQKALKRATPYSQISPHLGPTPNLKSPGMRPGLTPSKSNSPIVAGLSSAIMQNQLLQIPANYQQQSVLYHAQLQQQYSQSVQYQGSNISSPTILPTPNSIITTPPTLTTRATTFTNSSPQSPIISLSTLLNKHQFESHSTHTTISHEQQSSSSIPPTMSLSTPSLPASSFSHTLPFMPVYEDKANCTDTINSCMQFHSTTTTSDDMTNLAALIHLHDSSILNSQNRMITDHNVQHVTSRKSEISPVTSTFSPLTSFETDNDIHTLPIFNLPFNPLINDPTTFTHSTLQRSMRPLHISQFTPSLFNDITSHMDIGRTPNMLSSKSMDNTNIEECSQKKSSHKMAEQQRRNQMKKGFDNLRLTVPGLRNSVTKRKTRKSQFTDTRDKYILDLDDDDGDDKPANNSKGSCRRGDKIEGKGISKIAVLKIAHDYVMFLKSREQRYQEFLQDVITRQRQIQQQICTLSTDITPPITEIAVPSDLATAADDIFLHYVKETFWRNRQEGDKSEEGASNDTVKDQITTCIVDTIGHQSLNGTMQSESKVSMHKKSSTLNDTQDNSQGIVQPSFGLFPASCV